MAKTPRLHVDLQSLNQSELILLAKWNDLPASRAMSREMLIDSLENFHPVDAPMPVDDLRKLVSTWLTRNWDRVRMQLPKKVCPDCFKCRDLQVLNCYTKNESLIKPGPGYVQKVRAK
jgi:hypothetical protein